jgi:hypothetical protein
VVPYLAKKRAREAEVAEELLEDVDDADDIKSAVIQLILDSTASRTHTQDEARSRLVSELTELKIKALKKVDMDKWGRQIAILNEVLVSLYEEDPLDLLTITRKTDQLHEAQSELRLLLQIHPQPNADDARHHLM